MKIQYPILLEKGDENTAFGIIVPDLPGCFSAADNESDRLDNAREAILLQLEALDTLPKASRVTSVKKRGFVSALIDIDLSLIEGKTKRINVTIPADLLMRIDAAAKTEGKTRSAYLTIAALHEINR